ncbi:MAG: DUF4157 domain-containing protein, partial [Myxococcota bacterium]
MQRSLGSRLQFDLSDVRIHHDGEANRLAADHGARAVAAGSHVAFGAGEFRPHTRAGFGLLVHELAHVAQYREGADVPSRAHESEADAAARAVTRGDTFRVSRRADGVQRFPLCRALLDAEWGPDISEARVEAALLPNLRTAGQAANQLYIPEGIERALESPIALGAIAEALGLPRPSGGIDLGPVRQILEGQVTAEVETAVRVALGTVKDYVVNRLRQLIQAQLRTLVQDALAAACAGAAAVTVAAVLQQFGQLLGQWIQQRIPELVLEGLQLALAAVALAIVAVIIAVVVILVAWELLAGAAVVGGGTTAVGGGTVAVGGGTALAGGTTATG